MKYLIATFLLSFGLVSCIGASAQTDSLQTDKQDTLTIVEHMPEFPGGEEGLAKFLQENIVYPEIAKKKKIQGTVYISFIINSRGEVEKSKVIRGVHKSINKEALRVINLMPKWTPGTQGGKLVRVQFNLPIDFKLQ